MKVGYHIVTIKEATDYREVWRRDADGGRHLLREDLPLDTACDVTTTWADEEGEAVYLDGELYYRGGRA